MADKSDIAWTDATWNIITGCSVKSPGCKHCYAMKLAGTRLRHHSSRVGLTVNTANGPVWTGETRFNDEWLDQPLRWTKPRKIFPCAHGDLFHESVPFEWIDKVFAVMSLARWHTFQILTKRSDRMLEYLTTPGRRETIAGVIAERPPAKGKKGSVQSPLVWPLPNAHIGVSVENQAAADVRVADLVRMPAAVRWISAEPMLGSVVLRKEWLKAAIDWVVVGGESGGHYARPLHPYWVRALRDQCRESSIAFLFKQWGEWRPISEGAPDWYADLYRPNKIARGHVSQDVLDDIHGRTCVVPDGVLLANGRLLNPSDPDAFKTGAGSMQVFCCGTSRAGRLLDGVLHDEHPKKDVVQ